MAGETGGLNHEIVAPRDLSKTITRAMVNEPEYSRICTDRLEYGRFEHAASLSSAQTVMESTLEGRNVLFTIVARQFVDNFIPADQQNEQIATALTITSDRWQKYDTKGNYKDLAALQETLADDKLSEEQKTEAVRLLALCSLVENQENDLIIDPQTDKRKWVPGSGKWGRFKKLAGEKYAEIFDQTASFYAGLATDLSIELRHEHTNRAAYLRQGEMGRNIYDNALDIFAFLPEEFEGMVNGWWSDPNLLADQTGQPPENRADNAKLQKTMLDTIRPILDRYEIEAFATVVATNVPKIAQLEFEREQAGYSHGLLEVVRATETHSTPPSQLKAFVARDIENLGGRDELLKLPYKDMTNLFVQRAQVNSDYLNAAAEADKERKTTVTSPLLGELKILDGFENRHAGRLGGKIVTKLEQTYGPTHPAIVALKTIRADALTAVLGGSEAAQIATLREKKLTDFLPTGAELYPYPQSAPEYQAQQATLGDLYDNLGPQILAAGETVDRISNEFRRASAAKHVQLSQINGDMQAAEIRLGEKQPLPIPPRKADQQNPAL